jgi:hypothetical protein
MNTEKLQGVDEQQRQAWKEDYVKALCEGGATPIMEEDKYVPHYPTTTPKPILCISYAERMTHERLTDIRNRMEGIMQTGWYVVVMDDMPISQVQAFMPQGGNTESLDMSLFEEWMSHRGGKGVY